MIGKFLKYFFNLFIFNLSSDDENNIIIQDGENPIEISDEEFEKE
mgnify:FL=1